MGRNPVLIGILEIVNFRGNVDDDGLRLADALKPVVHEGGNLEEDGVMLSHEKLVDLPEGGGLLPPVVENHLHHPPDHHEMVELFLVVVPGLHRPRVGRGHVNLPEPDEDLIIRPEHFHQPSPFIGNDFQLFDLDAVDHLSTVS